MNFFRPRKIANEDFPIWQFPLKRPHAGIKLGNNRLGLLVWGEGQTLQLSFGVPTLWDHDGGAEWREGQSYEAICKVLKKGDEKGLRAIFPPTPKTPQLCPMGRVTLDLGGRYALDTAYLDIHTGTLAVQLTGRYSPTIILGVDWESGALFVILPPGGPTVEARVLAAYGQPQNTKTFESRGFQPPRVEADGFEQLFPHDDAAGLAIVRRGRAIYAAVVRDGRDALAAARAKAQAVSELGAEALRVRTARRWRAFWNDVPRVSVPNRTLQAVFDYGMYQFGAGTDDGPDAVAAPLQGPWYSDHCFPPWGGDYHFNINLQEYYWPAYHGNRLEHLRPVFDMIASWLPRLRANAKVFVGIDDGVMLPHAVDDTGKAMTAGFWTGMMDHGSTMWMADMMWRYYEFGGKGGKAFLRDKAMPFMAGAFNVFYRMLAHEKDGSLALPVGSSPEYRGADMDAWGRNASFQLAAAHRLAENLQLAAKALGQEPDPRWAEVREKLPLASVLDHAVGQGRDFFEGYGRQIGLWDGQTIELSHRHHSHLAGIFPFDTIPLDDPDWHEIVSNSFATWIHYGPAFWSGWCVPWASILSTRVGNADAAEFLLEFWERFFTNEGRGTLHDCRAGGLNMMGRPPLEEDTRHIRDIIQFDAAGGATEAIFQMLCHERMGVTHLFRGAPARWLDVSFEGIRSTDGVLVSAARRKGAVVSVSLTASVREAEFRLANPWPGRAAKVVADDGEEILPADDVLVVRLRKGETVRITRGRASATPR